MVNELPYRADANRLTGVMNRLWEREFAFTDLAEYAYRQFGEAYADLQCVSANMSSGPRMRVSNPEEASVACVSHVGKKLSVPLHSEPVFENSRGLR